MVYIKKFLYGSGCRPSPAALFNYKALTASQKLKLASCRIFKTFINSNYSKGMNKMKKKVPINHEDVIRKKYYLMARPLEIFPFMKGIVTEDKINASSHLERRKMRILMKGIKVGVKKGGKKVNIAGIVSKLN